MQVTETLSEGLKREFKVVVPREELEVRLNEKLEELKGTTQIRGFRPGKVPIAHLRRLAGRQTMSQIVNDVLNEKTTEILRQRDERPALQPKFTLTEDEAEANNILDAKADLEYGLAYEILPRITLGDFKTISVERPIVDVPDSEIERQMLALARNAATYSPKDGPAGDGDRVTIDYVGKVDGNPFEGGADYDANIILGSRQFIPGFEEQLLGATAGEQRVLNVTFPDDYGAPNLAGKAATFDVNVKEVAAADSVTIDDELAKKLGVDDVEKMRQAVKAQLNAQNQAPARQRVKRQLLDQLDTLHKFDSPPSMVAQEFDAVWREVVADFDRSGRTFDQEGTTEAKLRDYYRGIADRRVRLGLVLAEIGERNRIEVTDQELQRALANEVRRNPGNEQQIYDFYANNPGAMNQLRAPLFEEKVIDFLLELVNVTDKNVTREELMAMIAADEPTMPTT
ncbi:MAG: trigger factor [Bauldia sp.]|nr:trigger factor [Bauldia sp.]